MTGPYALMETVTTEPKTVAKDGMKHLAVIRTMQIGIIPQWMRKRAPRQLDHLIRKGADTVTVATTEKYGCVASQTLLNVTMFVSASRLQLAKVAMPPLVLQILKLVRVAKRP